jgi:copper chaperone NosL
MEMKKIILSIIVAIGVITSGCEPEPQAIQYGSDECAYCKMMITEPEYGSQILNPQGRSYKFDSIECMAAYDLTNSESELLSRWVPDFINSGNWIEAEDAVYLHSETLRSPMGLYLSAYVGRDSAEQMQSEYGGEILDYRQVLELVQAEWLAVNGNGSMMMNH